MAFFFLWLVSTALAAVSLSGLIDALRRNAPAFKKAVLILMNTVCLAFSWLVGALSLSEVFKAMGS